jgi:K+-transporting ATPase, c chain/haloacid dehalogenase-like hydrolase
MITGDNRLTATAIAAEAGVDDLLAEATPEAKLTLIRRYQAEGRLVAMTGDGTKDAPALAQADVAVAMHSGTQAAREAGNMVDLDSNPTKLIEVVEIGKQMLMTRGALTTFSIANDVAKYFAIIPAAFATTYPQLDALNVMALATPASAILSAVIFNALIIVFLIPLALKGIRYRALGVDVVLRQNLLIYGLGGLLVPFLGIKLVDLALRRPSLEGNEMKTMLPPVLLLFVLLSLMTGVLYPLAVTGLAQVLFPHQANGSIVESGGGRVGPTLIGQQFSSPGYFWGRPSATATHPNNPEASSGSNLGPTNPTLVDAVKERIALLPAADPGNERAATRLAKTKQNARATHVIRKSTIRRSS